ncbi:MAG TPA: hypothetical protein VE029_14330 [Rhizobacter sp.]|nr:hypothetical protein [Rhizobacter sp.]
MLVTPPAPSTAFDSSRRLCWPGGDAALQALGGMLAPVVFRAPGRPDFSPLQVAPWADEPDADRWPGALRRLRGEWPCVPFGRCDRPARLPPGWQPQAPGDPWEHGYAWHHPWHWLDLAEPHALGLQIDLPADQDVRRLTRTVRAVPDAPALDIELQIHVRRACTLPVALHPTLRLNAGRVRLTLAHDGPGLTYPVPAEPGRSRVAADTRFDRLAAVALAAGGTGDFTAYPQASDSEELMQLMQMRGPVTAHFVDAGWALTLDWDRALLPDLMLWVSHGGRLHPPWNGRHFALGLEPMNAAFDLGRVACAPPDHPLAARCGLALTPDAPCVIRSRLSACPSEAAT